jgi:hypothetical protein
VPGLGPSDASASTVALLIWIGHALDHFRTSPGTLTLGWFHSRDCPGTDLGCQDDTAEQKECQ